MDILEQGGRLGSGSPETSRSEAGQHELRPDLRGLVGKVMTRGPATLESRGVIEKVTAHPTLPRAWREAGTEGR